MVAVATRSMAFERPRIGAHTFPVCEENKLSGLASMHGVTDTGLTLIAICFLVTSIHKGALALRGRHLAVPILELFPWRGHRRLVLGISATLEGASSLLLIGANGVGVLLTVLLLGLYSSQLARLPASAPCNCFPLETRSMRRLDARHGIWRNVFLLTMVVALWVGDADSHLAKLFNLGDWHYSAVPTDAGLILAAFIAAFAVVMTVDVNRPDPFRKVVR